MATADDSGKVKLFNYPCVVHDAPHRAYLGHSSHVIGVRFNQSGDWLCSTGGRDRAVFQFTTQAVAPPPPPPAQPSRVWAPLDDSGKSFGWKDTFVPELYEDSVLLGEIGGSVSELCESPVRMASVQEEDVASSVHGDTAGW